MKILTLGNQHWCWNLSQNHRTSKTSMNFVVLMLTLPAFDANNLKLFLLLLCPPGEYPRHCVRCACCVHCASCCVQSGPTFHDRRISKKSPRYPELHLMMDFFSWNEGELLAELGRNAGSSPMQKYVENSSSTSVIIQKSDRNSQILAEMKTAQTPVPTLVPRCSSALHSVQPKNMQSPFGCSKLKAS